MAALAAVSCQSDIQGEDAVGEGTLVEVTLDVRSRSNGTRATGTPEDPERDIEKIHSWWLVFASQGDGRVKAIVTRPADNTSYVEEESVKAQIPTGRYTVYSFANISQADLQAQAGLAFAVGTACPDVDAATLTLRQDWNPAKDIPMTGKQSVVVTGRGVVSLEVVRTLAKMDITFTNESGTDVTIESLKLSQSPTDQVPLLPNYTYLQEGMPEATTMVEARDYVRTYSPAPTLARYTGTAAASYRDVFYVRESQANYNVTGRYLMTVAIRREGATASTRLFALTRDLYSIYRNDHIVQPVVLGDFVVGMSARFYPPIGGYPAVVTSESDEEFYCQFGTEGDFELYPSVQDALSGGALVYGAGDPYYTCEVTGTSDPSHILDKMPSVGTTGEILGRLNSGTGTAYVDVRITIHRTGAADQIYDRRIYLIRK